MTLPPTLPGDLSASPVAGTAPPATQESDPAVVPGAMTFNFTTTQNTPVNKNKTKSKGNNGPHIPLVHPPKTHNSPKASFFSFDDTPISRVRPVSTVKDSSKRLQLLREIFEENGSDASRE
jgi:hypothetical protein